MEGPLLDFLPVFGAVLAKVVQTQLGKGWVGGAYSVESDENNAWLPLDVKDYDVPLAQEMLEFLQWPLNQQAGNKWPLASIPLCYGGSSWNVLTMVDEVLHGAPYVKVVASDNATNHTLVRLLLLGQLACLSKADCERVKKLKFFSRLTFDKLPQTKIRNLDYQIPKLQQVAIWGVFGVAHVQKNAVCQLRSYTRTVMVGLYFVDLRSGSEHYDLSLHICMYHTLYM